MNTMKHRISAGVIVEHEDKVLLVHHRKPGAYDFWVAPGGGAIGSEGVRGQVERLRRRPLSPSHRNRNRSRCSRPNRNTR